MLLVPSTTQYSVYPTYPPLSLLSYWPDSNPPALSPPTHERSLAYPFNISPDTYNAALHVAWPITIAILYASGVQYINSVNRDRKLKPWAFSQTDAFRFIVVAHNLLLALYSAWTFRGMLAAITDAWPGWDNAWGTAGAVDALCRMHGPRGLGSAAAFNTNSHSWSIPDISMRLLGGNPDPTDVGRIWNEGLAYYGWIFYLSKFYEVLDTGIILAKGKESSLLQTYHHAGAMFAMWAGIRYMSPPIWMFTFINSGLHTLMYTYYAISAQGIKVPALLKRTLTVLQIAQIIFGASYAFLHLFIAYDMPIYAPYSVARVASSAIPSAAASANVGSWFKKAALRAAGEEGLAENVRGQADALGARATGNTQSSQLNLVNQKTHCLDTSGQAFAIILNIIYLGPLAYLFISFFARYFTSPASQQALEQEKASADAEVTRLELEFRKAVAAVTPQSASDTASELANTLQAQLTRARDNAAAAGKKLQDALTKQRAKEVAERVQRDLADLRNAAAKQGSSANAAIKANSKKNINGGKNGDESPAIPAKADSRANNNKASSGMKEDPRAYATSLDMPLSEGEWRAERAMQP